MATELFGFELSGAWLAGLGAMLAGAGSLLSGLIAWKVGKQKLDESKREASGGPG